MPTWSTTRGMFRSCGSSSASTLTVLSPESFSTDVMSVQGGYNDDDKGFFALRQGFGAGAFVEVSYAEVEDAGFGNEDFVDDIREGTTLKVGLEF